MIPGSTKVDVADVLDLGIDKAVERSDLGVVLDAVGEAFGRYIHFQSQAQAVALALWTAHTHVIDAADCTPYVVVTSPEKQSGKTRLQEVASHMVRDGIRASSVSASALFRLVENRHPTLFVDEVDAIFGPKSDHEDLRLILDAGYERGNPAIRNRPEGRDFVPTAFDAFGPKMLAGLDNGKLPDTISDRSIPIRLQRKRAADPAVAKFRRRVDPPRLRALRERLGAWATPEVIASLAAAYPESAPGLSDREDDMWEPLLAIADMAGGDWPARARAAAAELHSGETDNESIGVLLLADIRDVLGEDEKIATADLAARLVASGERGPWAAWWGRDVESGSTAALKSVGHQIARRLGRHDIKPKPVWIAGAKSRGYEAQDFAPSFAAYLPPSSPPKNGRTVGRRSEAVYGGSPPEGDTPSDQASTVLPFPAPEDGRTGAETEPGDAEPNATLGLGPTEATLERIRHETGGVP